MDEGKDQFVELTGGYSEAEIYRKVRESRKLRRKLRRYWKRLVKRALVIVKQNGFDMLVTDGTISEKFVTDSYPNRIEQSADIIVYRDGDELTDDSRLLRLAKNELPDTYKKYNTLTCRYSQLRKEIKKIHDLLSKDYLVDPNYDS